jgi:hypothetical protein
MAAVVNNCDRMIASSSEQWFARGYRAIRLLLERNGSDVVSLDRPEHRVPCNAPRETLGAGLAICETGMIKSPE